MRVAVTLAVCFIFGLVEVSLADRDGERFGRRNRPQSSDTTGAPAACPRRRPCTKDCGTRGFMKAANGCELCACNPNSACPAIECPDSNGVCPFGWKEDENGCRQCECRVNPRCTGDRPMCMMFCQNGFVNGEDGCPTCECFDPATAAQQPAPAVEVLTVSSSQPAGRTRLGSRYHHQRDGGRDGSAPPVISHHSAAVTLTSSGNTTCGPICRMYCEYGMQVGPDGCPVCACNEPPSSSSDGGRRGDRGGRHHGGGRRGRGPQCHHPMCTIYCPNGYRRAHTGCTICECHQPGDTTFQVQTDASLQCPTLRCLQSTRCAHGFVTDPSTGCPMCTCRIS